MEIALLQQSNLLKDFFPAAGFKTGFGPFYI